MKILVINGPNINLLGLREPDIYGKTTYTDLCETVKKKCAELGFNIEKLITLFYMEFSKDFAYDGEEHWCL